MKKSGSLLSWRPYDDFFNFKSICLKIVNSREFVIAPGDCQEVQRFGRRCYINVPPTRLRDGYYELVKEEEGGYRFVLQEP